MKTETDINKIQAIPFTLKMNIMYYEMYLNKGHLSLSELSTDTSALF